MKLSVAYMTSRKAPMIEWFFDSLHNETCGDYSGIQVVVVDFHAEAPGRRQDIEEMARTSYVHVPPKPTFWQGRHRLTAVDYFAAANARNTAICHSEGDWIAFVDDLSVLLPGWLARVQEAMKLHYVVGGAYRKVEGLVVTDGKVVFCRETDKGLDSRWNIGSDTTVVPLYGGSLFGYMAAPLQAVLDANGYDERCDCVGMGAEDYTMGLMLGHAGHQIRYDRRMLAYESEERHHTGDVMVRVIEKIEGRKDASHEHLEKITKDVTRAPNPFNLAEMRIMALNRWPLPLPQGDPINWYSQRPINEY